MEILDQEWARTDWRLKSAAGTLRFWLLIAAVGTGSFCYQGVFMHAVAGMVDGGLEPSLAALFLGIMGILGSAGKIGFGFISDRMGREVANTMAAAVATLGILFIIFMAPNPALMALLFAILFGFGYGAAAPLFPSVVADLFISRSFGIIVTVIFMGASLGGASGPLLMGKLRDIFGNYDAAFTLSAAMLWVSCLFVWWAAPRKVRKIGRRKPAREMEPVG